MEKRRFLGKSMLMLVSLALMIVSLWEVCVRLDAMYAPVKMFFSMALGEDIPFSDAMSYFDYSIFEAPLWLTGCMLIGLLSIALSARPKGCLFILPVSLGMALYGLTRDSSFLTDFWNLIQPALLMIICALSLMNALALPVRRKRTKSRRSAPPDSPRMTDAPRLRRIDHDKNRRAG